MTVASTTSKVSAAGNGVTTAFAVAFPYRASADLVVILRAADGTEALQVETTNYTVSGAADAGTGGFSSGTVTMLIAPVTGTTLVISRKPALTQRLDAQTGGALTAVNLEGALDRLTMLAQSMQEQLDRAPLLKKSTASGPFTLPEPVASSLVGFTSDGLGLTTYSATTLAAGASLTTAYTLTLLDDPNAAAARTTLGLGNIATVGYLTGSAAIDFASTADNASSATSNITVTGAVAGDFVVAVSASGNIDTTNGVTLCAKVTAADTVGVFLINDSGGAFDPPSQTIRVLVIPKANVGL